MDNKPSNPSDARQFKTWGFRDQIDFEQARSIASLENLGGQQFWERTVRGYYKNFVNKSFKAKINFIVYCIYVLNRRTHILAAKFIKNLCKLYARIQGKPHLAPPHLLVAIHCTGALGDMMHHVPFIESFYHQFGPLEAVFVVSAKKMDERSSLTISALTFIKQVISENKFLKNDYDLLIEIRHIVKYIPCNHKRIAALTPNLLPHIRQADKRFSPFSFIFDNHPHLDGFFGRTMQKLNMNAAQASGYFGNIDISFNLIPALSPEPIALKNIERFGLSEKRYIVFHDGFESDKIVDARIDGDVRIMRSWPIKKWNELAVLLKKQIPDALIIQVGISKTSHVIDEVDLNLLDKTSMQEVYWIIKNACLHIDTESGLMRLAWAANVPTISLQGPSGTPFFHFYGITPIVSETCNNCYWVREDWNTHCVRELEQPECMISISAQAVANMAVEIIKTPVTFASFSSLKQNESEATQTLKDVLNSRSDKGNLFILNIGTSSNPLSEIIREQNLPLTILKFEHNLTEYFAPEPQITYRFGSLTNMPFASGCADIIISQNILEKYEEKEVRRLLKKDALYFSWNPSSRTCELIRAS